MKKTRQEQRCKDDQDEKCPCGDRCVNVVERARWTWMSHQCADNVGHTKERSKQTVREYRGREAQLLLVAMREDFINKYDREKGQINKRTSATGGEVTMGERPWHSHGREEALIREPSKTRPSSEEQF